MTPARFAALQASTAVKPEDSVSPTAGTREVGSPVSAGAARTVNAPVFGNVAPVRPDSDVQPFRPFGPLLPDHAARELRRRNAQGFTVDTVPYTPEWAWEHYRDVGAPRARAALPEGSRPGPGGRFPLGFSTNILDRPDTIEPVQPTTLLGTIPNVSVLSEASGTTSRSDTVPYSVPPRAPVPVAMLPRPPQGVPSDQGAAGGSRPVTQGPAASQHLPTSIGFMPGTLPHGSLWDHRSPR